MTHAVPFLAGLALLLAQPASGSDPEPPEPLFEVPVGPNGPLAGEDENRALLPVGGAPSSFAVDGDGRWWVLDAIGARVLVFERDGTLVRTIPFPVAPAGSRAIFRADIALDGAGGVFVVDATARRIEAWSADGRRRWSAGTESLPRGRRGLDLPKRVDRIGDSLFVADHGSERLLRFSTDGEFRDSASGVRALPLPGGGVARLTGDFAATWFSAGTRDEPGKDKVKIHAAGGMTLHDVALVGATEAGDAVLAVTEGDEDAPRRVRILLLDREGKTRGERVLAVPDDEAMPTRRWRLTPSGDLAWFRVSGGRFQAIETTLPERAGEDAGRDAVDDQK